MPLRTPGEGCDSQLRLDDPQKAKTNVNRSLEAPERRPGPSPRAALRHIFLPRQQEGKEGLHFAAEGRRAWLFRRTQEPSPRSVESAWKVCAALPCPPP